MIISSKICEFWRRLRANDLLLVLSVSYSVFEVKLYNLSCIILLLQHDNSEFQRSNILKAVLPRVYTIGGGLNG